MTVTVIELHGDEKKYLDALNKVMQKNEELEKQLKAANKAASDAAAAVGSSFKQTEQDQDRVLSKLQAQLRQLGPEGQAAAQAMAKHLASGGQSSEVAIDGVIAKVREMSPALADAAAMGFQAVQMEAAEAARIMEAEAAEAAKYSEGAFAKPLDKLRQMGPEGRKAAEMLKAHLVEAGKIGERSMGDIIEELRKIDPEAAKAAEKIQSDLSGAADQASGNWEKFGVKAISAVSGIAASYVSLQSAIQLVNAYLEDQVRLQSEVKDSQESFGSAQQATLANLAGMSKSDQDYLVGDAITKIAKDAKFGDRTKIIQAIGAVASAGVEDREQIVQIVTAAAKTTNLNPDQLKGNAVSAAAIMAQANLKDPNEALALATTAGPLSKIEDLSRLARVLPVALAAVGANTKGLSPQQAAKEGTSMFSIVGQAAQDELGESTRTFMVGFSGKLNTFYADLAENRAKAMDEIIRIEKHSGSMTEQEKLQLPKLQKIINSPRNKDEVAKAKDKLAKIMEHAAGDMKEEDKLKLPKLKAFLAESEGIQDPGGLIARVEMLQKLPAVADLFKEKTTVEQQFQPALGKLLNPNDPLLGQVKEGVSKLSTDAAFYEEFANRMQGATKQISLGTGIQSTGANVQAFRQSDSMTEATRMASIRELSKQTNESIRTSLGMGFESFTNYATDFPSLSSWSGRSANEEAGALIVRLLRQRQADASKPQTPAVQQRTAFIERQIELLMTEYIARSTPQEAANIRQYVGAQIGGLRDNAAFQDQFGRDVKSNEQFQQMISLLEAISDKLTTEPVPTAPALSANAGQ